MFTVIQSNDTQILAKHLSTLYQKPLAKGGSIFDPFLVIVPAMVLDEWLKKTIAKHSKISTLITTQFWGQYQWQLIDKVLKCDTNTQTGQEPLSVPDMAVLSQAVIRWRIFAYLMGGAVNGATHNDVINNGTTSEAGHANTAITVATLALSDDTHPLHELLSTLTDPSGTLSAEVLWRFCETLARLYVQYLTERTDWLHTWAMGGRLDVPAMIAKKDAISQTLNRPEWQESSPSTDKKQSTDDEHATPAWLFEHYVALEKALAFLWRTLFAQVFLYRERLETRFWELLADKSHPNHTSICQTLPKTIHLFTVQQLPQTELNFLKKLSTYTDVVLLYFNPSAMFWADIVDKNWLATQRIIRPQAVYLKDYGHGLLSRLGKASRETFAMLADMAGGELSADFVVDWQDDFNEFEDNLSPKTRLLTALKKDILMLEETALETALTGELETKWQTHLDNLPHKQKPASQFVVDKADDSLLIHNCHSIKRELEVARAWIGRWLNEPNADGTRRKLSDVAIMLPDVESHRELLSVMFSDSVGLDGLVLPAKITGVQDKDIGQLWSGIAGLFGLTAGRFYYQAFCEWLLNPYVYQAFGMDMAMALRACELLKEAGFVRGLNETHLAKNLSEYDRDYRLSFAYALDRLVASLVLAEGLTNMFYPFTWHTTPEKTATLAMVRLEDEGVVQALCRIYHAFIKTLGAYESYRPLQEWLVWLEFDVIECYFYRYKGEEIMRGIFEIVNRLKASLKANLYYAKFDGVNARQPIIHQPKLPLKFVLETIATAIASQKISAETSDVIQIGRFGSLRGISFGLVVMVGMNLSAFPRTEPISRLDLTKAGLPRRGDRVSEDDDNGAFLEALLQARDNCWIFYSGQTASNQGERLPASPVGELIQFIKNSTPQTEQAPEQPKEQQNAQPPAGAWFVIKHPALPFEQGLFEMPSDDTSVATLPLMSSLPPPPPLWQAVYQASKQNLAQPSPIVLPTPSDVSVMVSWLTGKGFKVPKKGATGVSDVLANIELPTSLTLEQLTKAITKPNRAYLAGRLARVDTPKTDKEEWLGLDKLGDWQVGQLMLSAHTKNTHTNQDTNATITTDMILSEELEHLYYEPILPAGASRTLAVQQTLQKTQATFELFFANQALLVQHHHLSEVLPPTPIYQTLHSVSLPIHVLPTYFSPTEQYTLALSANLPAHEEQVWRTISPSQYSSRQHILAFIRHVCWQLVRRRDDNADSLNQQAGVSFWQFSAKHESKETTFIAFAPIECEQAKQILGRFVLFAELAKVYPIALTSNTILAQLTSDDIMTLSDSALKSWCPKDTQYTQTDYISENSSSHPDWQIILGDTDKKHALQTVLPLILPLYQAMRHALIRMDG